MRTGHNKAERQSHAQRSGSTHKHQKCGALVGVRPCLVLHCTAQYSSLYGFVPCFYLSSSHRVFIPSYSNIILSANNTVQTSTIYRTQNARMQKQIQASTAMVPPKSSRNVVCSSVLVVCSSVCVRTCYLLLLSSL